MGGKGIWGTGEAQTAFWSGNVKESGHLEYLQTDNKNNMKTCPRVMLVGAFDSSTSEWKRVAGQL